jgi:hypothetical protein
MRGIFRNIHLPTGFRKELYLISWFKVQNQKRRKQGTAISKQRIATKAAPHFIMTFNLCTLFCNLWRAVFVAVGPPRQP